MCLLNKTGVFGYFTTRDPIQICSLFTIISFFYTSVIAASCGVVIVAIVVGTTCYKICRKYKRRSEPVPLYKPPEDIAHQQNTAISRPDRESTAVCIDSAPSTGISTGISTESGHSDDHE